MKKAKFLLVRHGETQWNAQRKLQGHADIPLNLAGHKQASSLTPLFEKLPHTHVFSSDLKRARETAKYIADINGIPIQTDPRLRETFMGEAEGLTYEEVTQKFGEELVKNWRSAEPNTMDFGFPGGETKTQVVTRAKEALIDIANLTNGPTVISSHGGLIRLLITTSRPDLGRHIFVKNCTVYELEYDLSKNSWWSPLKNLNA